jgi:hypothetical protein
MAYTQTDLDSVQAAVLVLAAGERVVRVSVADLVVEYNQSRLSDLKALRSEIRAELSAVSGTTPQDFADHLFLSSSARNLAGIAPGGEAGYNRPRCLSFFAATSRSASLPNRT